MLTAYAMLLNVESQKIVHKNFEEVLESSVMMIKSQNFGKNGGKTNMRRRENGERKEERYCDHCKMQGHLKETCFKINGYPEWYVELMKTKKEKKLGKQVNMLEAST